MSPQRVPAAGGPAIRPPALRAPAIRAPVIWQPRGLAGFLCGTVTGAMSARALGAGSEVAR